LKPLSVAVNREAMRRILGQGLRQLAQRVNGLGIGSQNHIADLESTGTSRSADRDAGYDQRLTALTDERSGCRALDRGADPLGHTQFGLAIAAAADQAIRLDGKRRHADHRQRKRAFAQPG
jgi:hypothetical protein